MKILATDLDGTFIPLDNNAENQRDLVKLQQFLLDRNIELVYVTGRRQASVEQVIQEKMLPIPTWMICDVGTTVVKVEGDQPTTFAQYQAELAQITNGWPIEQVRRLLAPLNLELQEPNKQTRFKLSYYAAISDIRDLVHEIEQLVKLHAAPYSVVSCHNPFDEQQALIDLLPQHVNKGFALRWLMQHWQVGEDELIFCGDSGNDLAALTSGLLSIVVSNATQELKDLVQEFHQPYPRRLFIASKPATSGLLEGLKHFADLP